MLMRGGTSRGLYILAEDLPQDIAARDAVLLSIMGSPDARQIDVTLYKKFFVDKFTEDELKQKLGQAYQGFDAADWKKLQQWLSLQEIGDGE